MATKKKLAKALRQLSKETPSIAQTPITRVQVHNGKRYTSNGHCAVIFPKVFPIRVP